MSKETLERCLYPVFIIEITALKDIKRKIMTYKKNIKLNKKNMSFFLGKKFLLFIKMFNIKPTRKESTTFIAKWRPR